MKLSLRFSLPLATLLAFAGCSEDSASQEDTLDAGETPADDDSAADDDLETDDDVPADDDLPADDDVPADDDLPTEDAGLDDGGLPDAHEVPEDAGAGVRECALIASQCHEHDRGTGDLGDECHDIGHAGDPAECLEAFDACIAYCSPDGGHEETPDAGAPLCEEMGHLCHDLGSEPDAGLAAECHEVGHAGDEAACGEIYDECVALCGGHGHQSDAGPHEGTDGGGDAAATDAGLDASAADGG